MASRTYELLCAGEFIKVVRPGAKAKWSGGKKTRYEFSFPQLAKS